jgi:hypothetical protein
MGDAVDHETTHAADPLTAVMIEGDGLVTSGDQPLIHHVKHLQEGHIRTNISGLVLYETALVIGVFLTPYM